MWQQLLVQAGQACIAWLAQEVREAPVGGAETGEGTATAPPPPGCPACQAHRELAEARSLLEGMALEADQQGRVPGHVASTLRLVETCLEVAEVRVGEIAQRRPELAARCEEARASIQAARTAVPARQDLDRTSAEHAAIAAAAAWRSGYALVAAYFAPLPADDPELRELVSGMTSEQRRQLMDILRAA